jgi:hypothetical protein
MSISSSKKWISEEESKKFLLLMKSLIEKVIEIDNCFSSNYRVDIHD